MVCSALWSWSICKFLCPLRERQSCASAVYVRNVEGSEPGEFWNSIKRQKGSTHVGLERTLDLKGANHPVRNPGNVQGKDLMPRQSQHGLTVEART